MRPAESTVHTIQLTEKALRLSEADRQYFFKVDRRANKLDIKRAVEELFSVEVTDVRTLNRQGKKKRDRRMHEGKQSNWKRAIVTLKEGDSIDVTA